MQFYVFVTAVIHRAAAPPHFAGTRPLSRFKNAAEDWTGQPLWAARPRGGALCDTERKETPTHGEGDRQITVQCSMITQLVVRANQQWAAAVRLSMSVLKARIEF